MLREGLQVNRGMGDYKSQSKREYRCVNDRKDFGIMVLQVETIRESAVERKGCDSEVKKRMNDDAIFVRMNILEGKSRYNGLEVIWECARK